MAPMVAKGSSICASQLSPLSLQEKGSRNKRKLHTDPPISDNCKVLPSELSGGLSYEHPDEKYDVDTGHEQLGNPCNVCGVCQDPLESLKASLGLPLEGSSEEGLSEEGETDDLRDTHWSDLTEGQLEALVLGNLDTIFKGAIKKIVACGYTEEDATKAVLKSGFCYASKDTVPNIVDCALSFLRDGKDLDSSRDCFEDLQQLAKHVLVKLVSALRGARPSFSTGDAMWCLLICDMNVSHAFGLDGDPLSGLIIDDSSNYGPCSTIQDQSKAEPKSAEMSLLDPHQTIPKSDCCLAPHSDVETVPGEANITEPNKSLYPSGPALGKEGSLLSSKTSEKDFCANPVVEEKTDASRKMHSNSSKNLRQKSFQLDKSYKAGGTKGAFRAAKFSGFLLDKRYKSISDSAVLNLKSASVKLSKAVAMGVQLDQEHGALNLSTNSSFSSSSLLFNLDPQGMVSTLPKTDLAPPLVKPISQIPIADTELSLSLPSKSNTDTPRGNVSGNVKTPNPSPAALPYDRSLAQWIPQDEKDEIIMKLIPRIRELQNQLQEWTEWANQKVMQAARRLSKDKAELKTLRHEKEEVERLRKEKQSFEDNTMKKLSEMENALGKASGQMGRANAAVRRLQVENAELRREMEVAKLRAAESAASCQEVSKREKKMLTNFQSWEKQKSTFQQELAAERRYLADLRQKLEQAKGLHNQLQVRWKQEEKAKKELLTQANLIRKEREQLEASVKGKEEAVRLKAKENLQKYEDDIEKLEKQISQLRLKTDSSKIAALKKGINGSMLTDSHGSPNLKEFQDHFTINGCHFPSTGGVRRERECVMCLSEEMSVVFLPCAHQVVCKMCNELHEKQGMNDCPSCRSPIVRRVCVRYAHP